MLNTREIEAGQMDIRTLQTYECKLKEKEEKRKSLCDQEGFIAAAKRIYFMFSVDEGGFLSQITKQIELIILCYDEVIKLASEEDDHNFLLKIGKLSSLFKNVQFGHLYPEDIREIAQRVYQLEEKYFERAEQAESVAV